MHQTKTHSAWTYSHNIGLTPMVFLHSERIGPVFCNALNLGQRRLREACFRCFSSNESPFTTQSYYSFNASQMLGRACSVSCQIFVFQLSLQWQVRRRQRHAKSIFLLRLHVWVIDPCRWRESGCIDWNSRKSLVNRFGSRVLSSASINPWKHSNKTWSFNKLIDDLKYFSHFVTWYPRRS